MRKIFFLILAIAIATSACSRKVQPVQSLDSAGGVSATSIRIMSYNVHHCNPPSKAGIIDIDAIVKAIKLQNPDLVALQEIDVNTGRSGQFNQAKEIAKKLDMRFYFGKAIEYDGGVYGVAILSKYRLREAIVNRLPTQVGTGGEPRVLATAKIVLPNGEFIRFGTTHLDAQRDSENRVLQIKEINRIASEEVLPFIIAGDFNSKPGSQVVRLLDEHFQRTCMQCGLTVPVIKPKATIDFIAFAPKNKFEIISHEVIQEHYASDHLPVLAILHYKP